jgi:predicted nuclease of restriction endonuclease-like RecB superfamily
MLPTAHLVVTSLDAHGGRVAPRYLTARDEPWVRAALDRFDAFVGRTVAERDAEIGEAFRVLARDHGVHRVAAEGLAHVLVGRFPARIDAAIDPERARAVVFDEAGRDDVFRRDEALARAALRLNATEEQLERALFADRAARRRLVAPQRPPSPIEAVQAYNLALVQGLLLRSERVLVEVREHAHAVVRFAKMAGLLCDYRVGEGVTRIDVSGPLSLLRHTTKYGRALARFFPAVVATAGFRLEARCMLGSGPAPGRAPPGELRPVVVLVGAADPVGRSHALPRDVDSGVERALATDVRRLGSAWTLLRESDVVDLGGGRVFFPDFTLRHEQGFTVLVEVVGYYAPEYLTSKLEALRVAAARPLVTCVDERLPLRADVVPGEVLVFRRRVDAVALLALAERLRVRSHDHRIERRG